MDTSRVARLATAASLLLTVALAGCASTAARIPARAAKSTYTPAAPVLGPFPLKVGVREGKVQFTLDAVLIESTDAFVDKPGMRAGEQVYARPGHRFVEVTLVEWDTSIPSKPVSPSTGRKGTITTMTATADGFPVPLTGGWVGSGDNDPSKVEHSLQFEFPDGTREALLYVTASADATHALAFKLW